ncbi:MAG: hypothetical protein Gaeavirus14_7 [Gaeavirus sp.]|uniref:FNIP repeat-containing protein n=1 Tax=Gaeavirus sp. TaxID=2487767 RepID=A0A3G4ZZ34_9VIRU|nr:MAG: hypothetical protein Gaeavirus14_7 [Gaeavirus sp.]
MTSLEKTEKITFDISLLNIIDDIAKDLISSCHEISSDIIKVMIIESIVPPSKCTLQKVSTHTIILFNNTDTIDYAKYIFSSNIEEIFIQSKIDCSMVDFTCFTNLRVFHCNNSGSKNVYNLKLPDTLDTLHINTSESIIGITFPAKLHKLYLTEAYRCLLTGISFPTELEFIHFGFTYSLIGVILPESLTEIIVDCEVMRTIHEVILPASLTTIRFYSRYYFGFKVTIPSNFTCIETCYHTLCNKYVTFPPSLQKLKLIDSAESLDDLPNSIEELAIIDVRENVTNLPTSLKRIIVRHMNAKDIITKFTKLPYGCTVENASGDIIIR